MPLLPTLTLTAVNADASLITLKDDTGNYSVSNTGGFGTPNPAEGSITGILLKIASYSAVDTYLIYKLTSDERTALLGAGQAFSAVNFAGISTGTLFSDAVYDIKYNLLFNSSVNLTFASGGVSNFTLVGADTIFASAVGFVLPTDLEKIYYIDRTKTLDSAGGYVTEALPDTGATTAYQIVYEGDLKILIDKAGEKCLTEDIGIWAMNGCEDDGFRDIWKRYMQRIALRAKFTQGYMTDAHKLAVNIASYCDCTKSYTPCC